MVFKSNNFNRFVPLHLPLRIINSQATQFAIPSRDLFRTNPLRFPKRKSDPNKTSHSLPGRSSQPTFPYSFPSSISQPRFSVSSSWSPRTTRLEGRIPITRYHRKTNRAVCLLFFFREALSSWPEKNHDACTHRWSLPRNQRPFSHRFHARPFCFLRQASRGSRNYHHQTMQRRIVTLQQGILDGVDSLRSFAGPFVVLLTSWALSNAGSKETFHDRPPQRPWIDCGYTGCSLIGAYDNSQTDLKSYSQRISCVVSFAHDVYT